MSNEEKHKILKDKGEPVHIITTIDTYGGVVLVSIIIGIFLAIIVGGLGIFFTLPIMFIMCYIKMLSNKYISGVSMTFKCVYCDKDLKALAPSPKMNCIYCKKDIGYFDGKVYKITKDNEKCFQSTEEKVVKEIKKNNNKSNLSQIKELKELLDMGAITQEEFDEKKKDLLN